VRRPIHMCDMTHSCGAHGSLVWRTSLFCVTCLELAHCNTNRPTATHCLPLKWDNNLSRVDSWRNFPRCNTHSHNSIRCSTLQHTAAHCTTLHHIAPHCNMTQHTATHCLLQNWDKDRTDRIDSWRDFSTNGKKLGGIECCSVLQCVTVCCSVLQCVSARGSAWWCVAVCGSVLQCVAVCCSAWQCVAVHCSICSVWQRLAVCGNVLQRALFTLGATCLPKAPS